MSAVDVTARRVDVSLPRTLPRTGKSPALQRESPAPHPAPHRGRVGFCASRAPSCAGVWGKDLSPSPNACGVSPIHSSLRTFVENRETLRAQP